MVAVKKAHPEYGAAAHRRCAQALFPDSRQPGTVHKTLSEKGLVKKAKRKPVKNPPKPRFFERARPNQMWQSDILTFRLAGRNAYLIGFMDDYSPLHHRAWGCTAARPPSTCWRPTAGALPSTACPRRCSPTTAGSTPTGGARPASSGRCKRTGSSTSDRRPHHPDDAGQDRAVLEDRSWASSSSGRSSTASSRPWSAPRFWVKYYNHKRPHQGIGGLCPADRFFEIAHDLKKTLEQGVEENVLELALRGRPVDPFYMVGRMGGQSVVIRAEKGKVRMLVDEASHEKELVYDARKDIDHEDKPTNPQSIRTATEDNGRVVDLERAPHERPGVPGDFRSARRCWASGRTWPSRACSRPWIPTKKDPLPPINQRLSRLIEKKLAEPERTAGEAAQNDPEGEHRRDSRGSRWPNNHRHADGAAQGRADHEGSLRPADRPPGRRTAGGLAQDVLQVGAAGTVRPAGQCDRPASGPPVPSFGRPSPMAGKAASGRQSADRSAEPQDGAQRCADGSEASPDRQRPGEKKMSVSEQAVAMIEAAKTKFSLSYACLCGPGGAELSDADALETAACRRHGCRGKTRPEKGSAVESCRAEEKDPGSGSRPQTQPRHRQTSWRPCRQHLPQGTE